MRRHHLVRRNDEADCPVRGAELVVGSSSNFCPQLHYHQEHILLDGIDYLSEERWSEVPPLKLLKGRKQVGQ